MFSSRFGANSCGVVRPGLYRSAFYEHALSGQVHHQYRARVRAAGDMVYLDRHLVVFIRPAVVDRLDRFRLWLARQRIRLDCAGLLCHAAIKGLIGRLRNDSQSFCDRGPHATRVIEMVVGVHELRDAFVRHELLRFGYRSQRPRFVWRFDQHQVITELDEHTVV